MLRPPRSIGVRHLASFTLAALLSLLVPLLTTPPALAQGDVVIRVVATDLSQFPRIATTVSASTTTGEPVEIAQWFVDLGGTTITSFEATPATRPLAVSLVVDLSARMSDRGTPAGSRFVDMKPLLDALVDQLAGGQHEASLITFSDRVQIGHPLSNDLGAIRNTLSRSNTALMFEPTPLSSAAPDSPYPLVEAVQAGLDQLAGADSSQSLALVLFAAGEPTPQELTTLRASIGAYSAKKRPIRVLVFSFGSDAPGSFDRLSADPNGLEQLAFALNGAFFPLGITAQDVTLRQAIDAAYAGLLRRSQLTTLHFVAENVPAGQATLRVSASGAEDRVDLPLSAIGPRFNVVVDSRSFQDRVRVSIETKFAQAPIAQVEYLLDNRLITQPVTEGDAFTLEIDTYDPVFQERFPPGEYVLNAVATDTSGNQTQSEAQITVTVFAPPQGPSRMALTSFWWLGLIILGLAAGGGLFFVARRVRRAAVASLPPPRQTDPIPTPPPSAQSDDWFTAELAEGRARVEDKPTAELPPLTRGDDAPTGELPTHMRPTRRWFLEVVEGDDLILPDGRTTRRAELSGVYVDIGRTERNRLRVAPHYEAISRHHVTLGLFVDREYVELTDPESRHGTFIGDERTPIAHGVPTLLRSGDTFSLARLLKLRVVMEHP